MKANPFLFSLTHQTGRRKRTRPLSSRDFASSKASPISSPPSTPWSLSSPLAWPPSWGDPAAPGDAGPKTSTRMPLRMRLNHIRLKIRPTTGPCTRAKMVRIAVRGLFPPPRSVFARLLVCWFICCLGFVCVFVYLILLINILPDQCWSVWTEMV